MTESARATSADVAKRAGVSRTTVSFVLNDSPGQTISAATREAVLAAARELGYTPSAAARLLRSGSSRLVLCVAPSWQPSAIMDRAVTALTDALRMHGYATVLTKAAPDGVVSELLWRSVTPAAVVAMYDLPHVVRAQVDTLRVPLYDLWFHSSGDRIPVDDFQGAAGRAQVEHLLSRGAERLLIVAPSELLELEIRSDRLRGVRAAADESGVPAPDLVLLDGLHPSERQPLRTSLQARSGGRLGICAFNDLHAIATIFEARALGLHIPDDILIVGIDDDPVSTLIDPPLSSVRFDIDGHMSRVATRITDLARGVSYRGDELLATEWVVQRSST
ncbi:LacI family DNA-binding transcriptional regulator [Curtobacterium sp. ISL-83]|uniref:LacI family DNA-binding transcriptional regulator n=1 Tax=Curtobacterium sp. ISL-83 TaxID=2819145 RepID=UPI001BEC7FC5|nr:LacI family DNA-binding transcriptional regulator [Curtobacterium sp. ISL-83]MBT2501699.1 LacI family DNA-binding transcriptional regulator [Curtobacterium sp. ISL-83]